MNKSLVRFSRQTLIGSLSMALRYAPWLLVMPLLTRSFGTVDYGIWVQLIMAAELLAGIASLGLNFALLRYVPTYGDARHGAADLWLSISVCWAVSLLLAIIGWVADEWLAQIFLDGRTFAVRLALLFIPISGSLNLVYSYLRAARRAVFHTSLVALETAGWLVVAGAILYVGGRLWEMIVGLLAVKGLTLVIGAVTVHWRSGISQPSITKVVPYIRYGLPLLPLGFLQWIINASDRYFLSYYCDPNTVGIYSVSYGLGSIAGLAYAPIFFVLLPATSAAWNVGKSAEVLEYFRFAQKYPFLLIVPGTLFLTSYAKQAIDIIATEAFAAPPVLIACIAAAIAIMNICAIAQIIFNVVDLPQRILVIYIAAAAFNLLANTIAVPRFQAVGAAVATLVTYIFQAVLTYLMSRSILPFPWIWSHMAKVFLAAMPLFFALSYHIQQTSLQLLAVVGGCVAYVGILVVTGVVDTREWQLVRTVLNREVR